MSELASKKAGTAAGSDDAAAKKAAFLKEAEEAVRRAAKTESDRKSADKNVEVRVVCLRAQSPRAQIGGVRDSNSA